MKQLLLATARSRARATYDLAWLAAAMLIALLVTVYSRETVTHGY